MKICFIYNSIFRYGGVQRVVATIVNSLSKEHEVSIICNEEIDIENNFYNLDLDRVNIHYKKILSKNRIGDKIHSIYRKSLIAISNIVPNLLNDRMINNYYRKKIKDEFIKFINKNDYDIIIGCMMEFNLLLALVSEELNCKALAWEHNSYDSYFPYDKFNIKSKKNIYKKILSKIDKFIVLTDRDKINYIKSFDFQPIVIPNPLGISCLEKSSCDKKTILYVGRIESIKGTDLLINIFENFSQKNPEWKLNIVGEGILYEDIKAQIKNKNLTDKVYIYPFTQNIQEFYTQASIYACTSRFESFGLSVLEAMECGVPTITFNTSGPSEIIENNKNGIVVEKFDIDSYVDALNRLANDVNFRKKIAHNAIKRAKEYNIDNIINKWNSIINSLDI